METENPEFGNGAYLHGKWQERRLCEDAPEKMLPRASIAGMEWQLLNFLAEVVWLAGMCGALPGAVLQKLEGELRSDE